MQCLFQHLLADFLMLTTPAFSAATKCGEFYYHSFSQPVFMHSWFLEVINLPKSKEEFATMKHIGIVRHSNSPWASLLYMVPTMDKFCGHAVTFTARKIITSHDCLTVNPANDWIDCTPQGRPFDGTKSSIAKTLLLAYTVSAYTLMSDVSFVDVEDVD